ncbi:Predicted arabinose efflux permease, MFS family [Salinihabitans flavidus]|uniref:Predicted arabinose efflux permease, MFS family n=1 Tax=Salinihabitans flavidus TaxID=569882 RepID=A0A1H8LZR3_9RHOB|nr:MFS transporter [Salinihabitans flavidus]SEO10579.1 Predicted arabinose efflux permease, MFS family [Salinihabitans flavidus]
MPLLNFLRENAQWLAAGMLLTFLSSFGQTFFISIFAGEIRSTFNLSHGEWGGVYSIGTMASAAVMIWSGALTDQFRVRTIGAVIFALLGVSCLFMANLSAAWLLPFAIFCLRLTGQGMSSHLAVVAMARWFVATRGRALSIAILGFTLGEAVLPLLFVSLMKVIDWRWIWVGASGVAFLGIPVLLMLLRRERTPANLAKGESVAGMNGLHWTRGHALRHWLFWMMVPALLGPSAFNTSFFFHQVHYSEIKDVSHVALVALFPLFSATSVASMIFSGWALDRWGTGRLIPWSQLPMVLAFFLFSQAGGAGGLMPGLVLMGINTGATATLTAAFWAEFYGTRNIGAIKAVAAAIMVLGTAIGPGLTGGLIDFGIGLEVQYFGAAVYFLFTTAIMAIGVSHAMPLLPARSA